MSALPDWHGGSHYWAREVETLGHKAGIIASRIVIPYRKSSKNDDNHAEAICEAVSRPNMRFIPIKSPDQQAVLCLHRIRQALIKDRTAQINQIRGLFAELGLIMPKGRYAAQHHIPDILEDAENGLSMLARRLLNGVHQRILQLNQDILAYDREIGALARNSDEAKRLMTIPGNLKAPDTSQPGLDRCLSNIPRVENRLGRMTKRGDKYLRTLLAHGPG